MNSVLPFTQKVEILARIVPSSDNGRSGEPYTPVGDTTALWFAKNALENSVLKSRLIRSLPDVGQIGDGERHPW